MANDWYELADLVGNKRFTVTQVRLAGSGITIDGEFELPPLARLSYEDQVFVTAFLHSHGSIKAMEKAFGISYPTVKNRLNRIVEQLQLVHVETPAPAPPDAADQVLDLLERGEIDAAEAARRLR